MLWPSLRVRGLERAKRAGWGLRARRSQGAARLVRGAQEVQALATRRLATPRLTKPYPRAATPPVLQPLTCRASSRLPGAHRSARLRRPLDPCIKRAVGGGGGRQGRGQERGQHEPNSDVGMAAGGRNTAEAVWIQRLVRMTATGSSPRSQTVKGPAEAQLNALAKASLHMQLPAAKRSRHQMGPRSPPTQQPT